MGGWSQHMAIVTPDWDRREGYIAMCRSRECEWEQHFVRYIDAHHARIQHEMETRRVFPPHKRERGDG